MTAEKEQCPMAIATMNSGEVFPDDSLVRFDAGSYNGEEELTYLGDGELGGKAHRLALVKNKIPRHFEHEGKCNVAVRIPRMTVITTSYFDRFLELNHLRKMDLSQPDNDQLIRLFLGARLPRDLTANLKALLRHYHQPLAVRSSSILENNTDFSFAGVYKTRLIPNNEADDDLRLHKLEMAIKWVYASVFQDTARSYLRATPYRIEDEKMAVIIQEVAGRRYGNRLYPNFSGVARSYNVYPTGHARYEDGVVNLGLGLGKAIMDGSALWRYSPEYPEIGAPPFNIEEELQQGHLDFWAVNLDNTDIDSTPDPKTTEDQRSKRSLVKLTLAEVLEHHTLGHISSHYDYRSDRIDVKVRFAAPDDTAPVPPVGADQRINRYINMAPVNGLLKLILALCEETFNTKVEIEFALTTDPHEEGLVHVDLLQVRPLTVSDEGPVLAPQYSNREALVFSGDVMGCGCVEGIRDVIFMPPDCFGPAHSADIAGEVAALNRKLLDENKKWLLMGCGRWGSSDPAQGIPVKWGQISGARVIVESQLPDTPVALSQGSHFFHNLFNFGVLYFSVKPDPKHSKYFIDWDWLDQQPVAHKGTYITHVRLRRPLSVMVDGRRRKGVILK